MYGVVPNTYITIIHINIITLLVKQKSRSLDFLRVPIIFWKESCFDSFPFDAVKIEFKQPILKRSKNIIINTYF